MRKALGGTVAEFLDEFERDGMATFPFHKYTINRQKAMAREFVRVRWPGWLQLDVDFAENGQIITGREVQSEYWVTKQYTLFVQVVSWLLYDAWRSRDFILSVRYAVKVEPEGASVVDAIEPAAGFVWGEVVTVPSEPTASESAVYGVRKCSSSYDEPPIMVPRHRLRHRKLHTKQGIPGHHRRQEARLLCGAILHQGHAREPQVALRRHRCGALLRHPHSLRQRLVLL
jgi:hypothetical protein